MATIQEAQRALAQGKTKLLDDGQNGVVEWVGGLGQNLPARVDSAAMGLVLNFFTGHQERLNYVSRLRRGQSIGGGLVEGSIERLVNIALNQTGARWKVEHLTPLIESKAMASGSRWEAS